MIVYSHRGNLKGPNSKFENHPDYIDEAIAEGLSVEVDLRFDDKNFYLGHDRAQYKINLDWMLGRKQSLLFHCKEIITFFDPNQFHYFCHSKDEFVLTSHLKIWIHDHNLLINSKNLIVPLMNKDQIDKYFDKKSAFDVCTDFPIYLKNKI